MVIRGVEIDVREGRDCVASGLGCGAPSGSDPASYRTAEEEEGG
jgi:hypothetical protein